ncbi:MFS transporter [Nocardia higoensis]|uniref:MFS transporter n=1 Tax=Nocardia higoensis TaxID=228599 RepID=UPI00031B057B|nr:MFS transporter [Nocardia higoensis]
MATHAKPAARSANRLLTPVLCLSGVVVALQQTLVIPLLHEFPAILGVDYASATWLVTATLLAGAVATPIVSRLADMFGKRRMMLVSLATMVVGSVLAAVGGTFLMVLIGRGMQGLAAALVPVGIGILRDELPKAKVAGATALMSATLGIGSALGLPLSGVVFEHLGWEAIFWMSALAGALLFAAVLAVVPESPVRTPGRFDITGALLLSTGLAAALLAISKGGTWGWTDSRTLLSAAVAAVVFAVWFPFELRVNQPMVDLRTSARRPVLLTNISALLVGISMYGNMLSSTQQLEMTTETGYGHGLSVFHAGLCMVPAGLTMLVFAPIAGRLVGRIGAKKTLMIGCGVMVVAYLGRVFVTGSVPLIVLGAMCVTSGTAIAYATMPILIMGAVPITETASANGINALLRSIGTSVSSAMIAALMTVVTMNVAGQELPSLAAFQAVYVIAAVVALAAGAVAFFLPNAGAPVAVPAPGAGAAEDEQVPDELVARGMVCGTGGHPIRQAVVTVLRLTGEPVDWSRTDNAGEFSVVLPSPGPYLVIASADGWAPRSQVVDFGQDSPAHRVVFTERLRLYGRVTVDGMPCEDGRVSLVKATGEYVGTTVTGPDGAYEFTQPPTGRYLITVLGADLRTVTRQVTVLSRPAAVDIDLAEELQAAGAR